jgi:hypothetical protein
MLGIKIGKAECVKCYESAHAAPEPFWGIIYYVYQLPVIDDVAAVTGA